MTKSTRPPGASRWPKLPKEIQSAPDHRWQRGSEYSVTTIADIVPKTFRADGSVVAPPPEDTRSIQRADSGLDQLLRSGRITGTEVAAGRKFARDYEFAFHGASDPDRRLHLGRSEDGSDYSARDRFESARVDASTRYRKASTALGKAATDLLLAFCVEALSMQVIAAREVEATAAREISEGVPAEERTDVAPAIKAYRQGLSWKLAAALERLVEHYDDEEQARRRVRKQTQSTGEDMTKLTAADRAKPEYREPHDREKARRLRQLEEQKARDAAKAASAGEAV